MFIAHMCGGLAEKAFEFFMILDFRWLMGIFYPRAHPSTHARPQAVIKAEYQVRNKTPSHPQKCAHRGRISELFEGDIMLNMAGPLIPARYLYIIFLQKPCVLNRLGHNLHPPRFISYLVLSFDYPAPSHSQHPTPHTNPPMPSHPKPAHAIRQ